MGLLRDPGERGQRNVRRVEILLGLLGEDAGDARKGEPLHTDGPPGAAGGRCAPRGPRGPREANGVPLPPAASFARVAQMRLHDLLRRQEENCVLGRKDWVVQEASNPDALQEAGTFRYDQSPGLRADGATDQQVTGRRVASGSQASRPPASGWQASE